MLIVECLLGDVTIANWEWSRKIWSHNWIMIKLPRFKQICFVQHFYTFNKTIKRSIHLIGIVFWTTNDHKHCIYNQDADNEKITEKGHFRTYCIDLCLVLKTVMPSRCLLIIGVDGFPPQLPIPRVLYYAYVSLFSGLSCTVRSFHVPFVSPLT